MSVTNTKHCNIRFRVSRHSFFVRSHCPSLLRNATLRYFRYKSFSNVDEFRKELRTVNPFKIDVGAVYNVKPKDHKAFKSFSAEEREVVFDIDMTDYDDVR